MKVSAYKDPETGQLFETLKAFNDFKKDRAKAKKAEASEEALRAERRRITLLMCDQLASKSQMPELTKLMYESKLSSLPLRAGKKAPEVASVKVTSWQLTDSLELRVGLEVALSKDPHKAFKGRFQDLAPCDVLYPFRLWGFGGCTTGPAGEYVMNYHLSTSLELLPKLLENLKKASKLLKLKEAHDQALTQAVEAAVAADSQYRDLSEEAVAARAGIDAATRVWEDVVGRRSARKKALEEEVAGKMVFDQQAELTALKAATGLTGLERDWETSIVRGILGRLSKTQAKPVPEDTEKTT